jgi:hypothetical protein
MREHPDSARELPNRDGFPRSADPGPPALHFRIPERELHAEGHRLGVDAMRPPDHRRVAVLVGPPANSFEQRVDVDEDEVAGLTHLERERRIEHVG